MPEPAQLRSIAVAMAVHKDPGTLRHAVACMRAQSIATSPNWRLAIWLVCNGADDATREAAAGLAAESRADQGPPVLLRTLPHANLAAALNLVLRESDAHFVARMDADDLCPLNRLGLQAATLLQHPDAIACFGAWETRDASDATVQRFPAITDPRLVPWLLLVSNPFAHGSALLHRERVLALGGYDESFPRAQDYDLWLRLSQHAPIVSTPEPIYFHRIRHAGQGLEGARLQALHAARARTAALSRLPSIADLHGAAAQDRLTRLHDVLADVALGAPFAHDDPAPTTSPTTSPTTNPTTGLITRLITATGPAPTRESASALLWARGLAQVRSDEADRACFAACLREKWRDLQAQGIREIALWGAGRHTTRLLQTLPEATDPTVTPNITPNITPIITRIIDDHATGTLGNLPIHHPDALAPGDPVLISSDVHEAAIWERSLPLRQRGVRVFRLYAREMP